MEASMASRIMSPRRPATLQRSPIEAENMMSKPANTFPRAMGKLGHGLKTVKEVGLSPGPGIGKTAIMAIVGGIGEAGPQGAPARTPKQGPGEKIRGARGGMIPGTFDSTMTEARMVEIEGNQPVSLVLNLIREDIGKLPGQMVEIGFRLLTIQHLMEEDWTIRGS